MAITTLLAGSTACVARSPAPADDGPCTVVHSSEFPDIEEAIHRLVNRRRTAVGQPALVIDPRISDVARGHSAAMAAGIVPIGHERFPQRMSVLTGCLRIRAAFENITVLKSSPSLAGLMAIEEWTDSPLHRENIYREHDSTGIGVVLGADAMYYITQIYVRTR